jgi:hypothetical protein
MSSLPLPSLDARGVKSRADFFALASLYTRLRRAGQQFVGLCPFHSERHPSFYIHPEKKSFYCFGCGAGGDVFDFVMRIEHCDFSRAMRLVADFSRVVSRAKFRVENGNTCAVCGRIGLGSSLDVHHVLKRRAFPALRNYRVSMVVCCRSCHSLLEQLFPAEARYALEKARRDSDPQRWLRRFVLWRVKYGGREKVPFVYGRLDFSPEAPKGPEGPPAAKRPAFHSPKERPKPRAILGLGDWPSLECAAERASLLESRG